MAIGVAFGGVIIVCFCFTALICSLAFFSLGITALVAVLPYFHIDPALDLNQPYAVTAELWILIGISGTCSILALIFGCCSLRSKECGIFCVALILVVALIGEQVTMTKIYLERDETQQQIQNNLKNSLSLYNSSIEATRFWNDLQTNLECCGVEGPSDWSAVFGNSTVLPPSCCQEDRRCSLGSPDIWNGSCGIQVTQILQENIIAMFSVLLAIVIIEGILALACLILACWCCKGARVIIPSGIYANCYNNEYSSL